MHSQRRHHPVSAVRGFSLLETALVVLLVGSAVAAGFLVLQSRRPVLQVQAQEQALRWADQALLAYAARHARLPCAVADPGAGDGDCVAPGRKGWLPVRTLDAVHPYGAGPVPPLRYMVYRGGDGRDLALVGNGFNPSRWNGTAHALGSVNGLDLCAAIAAAARDTAAAARGDRARTTDLDGNVVNVAYGLSAAGPAPGGHGRHDGLNQQSAAVMEPPSRGADSGYDDRVRVRGFNALARSLGCGYAVAAAPEGLVTASLDILAMTVDANDQVDAQQDANRSAAKSGVVGASVSEGVAVVKVVLAAASVSNAASTLSTATAELSGAIASCVVLVGCALIPTFSAAVAAGAVAVGLAGAATAAAATALGLNTAALSKAIAASTMAQQTTSGGGPQDLDKAARAACVAAEGGWVPDVDENGDPIVDENQEPIPGHTHWQDGLRQKVDKILSTIADLKRKIASAKEELDWLNDFSVGPLKIDYDYQKPEPPPDPTEEEQAAYEREYGFWMAWRDTWERERAKRVYAIQYAVQQQYYLKQAEHEVERRSNELNNMKLAIEHLESELGTCGAPGSARCLRKQEALDDLKHCATPAGAPDFYDDFDDGHPCLPRKQAAYEEAVALRDAARARYWQAEARVDDTGWPPLLALIVEDQYRDTYKSWWAGNRLLDEQQDHLEKTKQSYALAQKRCKMLTELAAKVDAGGEPVPIWIGAAAILKAADCLGATGAVQPASCAVLP